MAAPRVINKPSAIASGVGAVGRVNGWLSTLMFVGPMLGGIAGWFAKKKWVSGASAPLAKLNEATGLLSAPLSEVADKTAGVFGKDAKITGMVGKASQTVSQYAQKILSPKVRERLSQNQLSSTIFSGTMAVGEATSTVLSFSHRISTLKQMQSDLTGKVPSTWAVLMGSGLHPLVREARKEMTGARASLGLLTQLGGVIGNVYMTLFSRDQGFKYMAKSMAVGMGTGMVANAITSGNTALTAYREMHAYAEHGKRPSLEIYEKLIGGLARNANYQVVHEWAVKCHEQNLTPDRVLKFVAETPFLKKSILPPAVTDKQALGPNTARELARRATSGKGATLTHA